MMKPFPLKHKFWSRILTKKSKSQLLESENRELKDLMSIKNSVMGSKQVVLGD